MEGRIRSSSSNPLKFKKNKVDGYIFWGPSFIRGGGLFVKNKKMCVQINGTVYHKKSVPRHTRASKGRRSKKAPQKYVSIFSIFLSERDTTTTYKTKLNRKRNERLQQSKWKWSICWIKTKKWNNNSSSSSPLWRLLLDCNIRVCNKMKHVRTT